MRLGTRIRANNTLRRFVRRNREKNLFWKTAARVSDMQQFRYKYARTVPHNYGVKQVQSALAAEAADRVRRIMRGEYV